MPVVVQPASPSFLRASGFTYSDEREPHRARTKKILTQHPEVKRLIGRNVWSFVIILTLVAGQTVIGWWCASQPWWVTFALAFGVGAFANHALFVMIHEASHNLIFKTRWLNKIAGIMCNFPMGFPSSESFQRYHLKHHIYQGVYELDADLCSGWEARLVGKSALGKAFWLLMYPVVQASRPFRLKEIRLFDGWIAFNWFCQIVFNVAVVWFLGAKALVYMLASLFFSVGLHILGARWIQEHYLVAPPQETYSYYGPLNLVAFNVGYHNEHHDFPSVPWNKLPAVKRTAPEAYDTLVSHGSWTALLFRFLFDKNLTLRSRMVRNERGGVALDDLRAPDQMDAGGYEAAAITAEESSVNHTAISARKKTAAPKRSLSAKKKTRRSRKAK
ncbi:MAG: fatty acid desaturase [Turneriella sp.]